MDWIGLLISGIVILFFGSLLFHIIKYGGFRGSMFRARIVETYGSVDSNIGGSVRTSVKVHRLENGNDFTIGMECISKSITGSDVTPLKLSRQDVEKLIHILQNAIKKV